MAFALVAWKSYSPNIDQPLTKNFDQIIQFSITGLNTDVALDIGNLTGTFWTNAAADVTYGTFAAYALIHVRNLATKATACRLWSETLDYLYIRSLGAPAAADQYQVTAFTNHIPRILFLAGGAPTAYVLNLHLILRQGEWPVAPQIYGTGL